MGKKQKRVRQFQPKTITELIAARRTAGAGEPQNYRHAVRNRWDKRSMERVHRTIEKSMTGTIIG